MSQSGPNLCGKPRHSSDWTPVDKRKYAREFNEVDVSKLRKLRVTLAVNENRIVGIRPGAQRPAGFTVGVNGSRLRLRCGVVVAVGVINTNRVR